MQEFINLLYYNKMQISKMKKILLFIFIVISCNVYSQGVTKGAVEMLINRKFGTLFYANTNYYLGTGLVLRDAGYYAAGFDYRYWFYPFEDLFLRLHFNDTSYIDFNSNRTISGLRDPINTYDVVNKNYFTTNSERPLTFSSPLTRSVNTISISQSTTSSNGYLTYLDWRKFNAKQDTTRIQPIAYGGTNKTSFSANGINFFDGTSIANSDSLIYLSSIVENKFKNGKIKVSGLNGLFSAQGSDGITITFKTYDYVDIPNNLGYQYIISVKGGIITAITDNGWQPLMP